MQAVARVLEQAAQVQAQPPRRAPLQVGAVALWCNPFLWYWPMVKSAYKPVSTTMGGRITANGGIDLTVSNGLENHATLNLNKLNVTGDTLNNSSGRINSTQTAVTVNTVNNVAGQIQTAGNSHIQANRLDNRTGLIRSEQGNTLVVNSIDNSNTQGTDQGIEGNTVVFH